VDPEILSNFSRRRGRTALPYKGQKTGTLHRVTQKAHSACCDGARARRALKPKSANHSLRATGITDYLKGDGATLGESPGNGEPCRYPHHQAL
jgi:hypothetical protein